jgi:hypothetical protein
MQVFAMKGFFAITRDSTTAHDLTTGPLVAPNWPNAIPLENSFFLLISIRNSLPAGFRGGREMYLQFL